MEALFSTGTTFAKSSTHRNFAWCIGTSSLSRNRRAHGSLPDSLDSPEIVFMTNLRPSPLLVLVAFLSLLAVTPILSAAEEPAAVPKIEDVKATADSAAAA